MTTWTMEQVSQARGLYVRVCLDASLVASFDEVRSVAADKMSKALVHEAHTFAIEMCRDDMAVKWSPDEDRPWQEWGEMRWHPSTKTVEMRGGHMDGKRLEVEKIGLPVQTATLGPVQWSSAINASDTLTPLTVTYELAGRIEDERVWVYATR